MSLSGTLKCQSLNDIILLLKSSDFIVSDLERLSEEPKVEPMLILRKWMEINPSMEFRVFVKTNEIVGTFLGNVLI